MESRQPDRNGSLSDSGNDEQHNTKIPGVVRTKGKGKKVGSIAFSPKTYEHREELRALGLVPDMSEKTWKGELDLFEQIDLARRGMIALRCECAEGSYAVKADLKEHGFRWDATRRRWFADLSTDIDWLIGLASGSKVNIWIGGYGIAYYWAEKQKEQTPSEPPYEPPLEEVHGFGDEIVSKEATDRSRLLARSYEMLSGTDKTEVATLLSSLGVPEDPEAAQIWAQQHRLEAVDNDTHLAREMGRLFRLLGALGIGDYLRFSKATSLEEGIETVAHAMEDSVFDRPHMDEDELALLRASRYAFWLVDQDDRDDTI